jgi:hypothetical protein
VDHATDAFFLHDERRLVIEVNRRAWAIPRDELIGRQLVPEEVGSVPASLAPHHPSL